MNIERLLKDAATAEMRQVRRETLPPLSLPAPRRRRPSSRWAVPVAAVLTVAAIVTMTVVLRGTMRGPDALGAHEGPPFFLATHRKGGVGVFDSWTGRQTADIKPRTGHYTQLAASADRRTFFLADEVATCHTRIDRVTLRRDGTVASKTTLPGELGAPVDEMAPTPDGRRLAIVFNTLTGCRSDDVAVVDYPSGRRRGWHLSTSDTPGYVASPAWAPDRRTLLLAAEPMIERDESVTMELRALDTFTTDTNLAHTRVAVEIKGIDLASFRPSPDGRTVTALAEETSDKGVFESIAVVRLPLSTTETLRKPPVRELARMTAQELAPAAPIDFRSTLDATGRHLLVSSRHDRAIFRLDDGHFRRLDTHRTDLGLIAW